MAKLFIRQYAKILYHVTQGLAGKDLDQAIVIFFQFLKRHQMLKKISVILDEFVLYAKEQVGIETVVVTTSRTMPKATIQEIAEAFSAKFELEHKIDDSLLGGMKVQKKNTVYDASVKLKLLKLKESLSN